MNDYEAWRTKDGSTFFQVENGEPLQPFHKERVLEKLFDVSAETWEDAMVIYHEKIGFEPYRPNREMEI